MRKAVILSVAAVLVAACARQPIIDTTKPDFDNVAYQQDLAICEQFADQVDVGSEALVAGLIGAAAGAALGAIGGAIAGDAGLGAAIGAATGGGSGVIGGGTNAYASRGDVLRNCLRERGYVVLD